MLVCVRRGSSRDGQPHPKYNHATFLALCASTEQAGCPKSSVIVLSAFALDFFRFDRYTFPLGAAGALSFPDPLEGTETGKAARSS